MKTFSLMILVGFLTAQYAAATDVVVTTSGQIDVDRQVRFNSYVDQGDLHIVTTFDDRLFKVGHLIDPDMYEYRFGIQNDLYEISFNIFGFQNSSEEMVDLETLIKRGQFDVWKKRPDGVLEVVENTEIRVHLYEKSVIIIVTGDIARNYDLSQSQPFFEEGRD